MKSKKKHLNNYVDILYFDLHIKTQNIIFSKGQQKLYQILLDNKI